MMQSASSKPGGPPPLVQLRGMIWGHMVTQALAVVARLGVADVLASGPLSSAELASRVGAHPDALYRLLRALASVGVFEETDERQVFRNSALSELLRDDARPSLRHLAMLNGGNIFKAWAHALAAVTSGKPAFAEGFGVDYHAFLAANPDEQAVFNRAMSGPLAQQQALLASRRWTGVKRVVDMGGGDGTLLLGLLAREPELEGVVFDLPQVEADARAKIAAANLGERCTYVAGSFLVSPPPEADRYVLARVLHNWDDEAARTVLAHCRGALRPGGSILILEEVLPDGNAPAPGKILDLQMLVIPGGRERTATEWNELLASAGFAITNVENGGAIEATPA